MQEPYLATHFSALLLLASYDVDHFGVAQVRLDRGQYRQAAGAFAQNCCLIAKLYRQSTDDHRRGGRGASGLSRQTRELGHCGAPFAPVGSTALEMPLEATRAELMLFWSAI